MRDIWLLIFALLTTVVFSTFIVLLIKYQEVKDDKVLVKQKERTYIFK